MNRPIDDCGLSSSRYSWTHFTLKPSAYQLRPTDSGLHHFPTLAPNANSIRVGFTVINMLALLLSNHFHPKHFQLHEQRGTKMIMTEL